MYYIWIPFFVLLAVYCYFEKKDKFSTATALKVILSAFVAASALYAARRLGGFPDYLMAVGLVFAVPADYFLQYIRTDLKKYRFGIFFFGAMHVCLIATFIIKWGIGWHEFAIWAGLILILTLFQNVQRWNLGKAKGQLSVYTVLVAFMASKAIAVYIAAPSTATLALALGGFMFFVSDLFPGIWNYYNDKFTFLALNRIIYFCGQMSLAFYLLLAYSST